MRIQIIYECNDCKFSIFDDNEVIERWGKVWCEYTDRDCGMEGIPEWCHLPDVEEETI